MRDQSKEIKAYILENLVDHSFDIVRVIVEAFSVTPTTVQRHMATLIKNGMIVKSGNTRGARYYLKNQYERVKVYRITPTIAEDQIFKEFNDIFIRVPKNIYDICFFGVTEMLNNAIDHSQGSKITLGTRLDNAVLTVTVKDDGVGVFKTICDYLHINDMREGILHLSKGKITRDPVNHTGQGIFFTSKMFNTFTIDANGYVYTKDNHLQDWSFNQRYGAKGTEITMAINVHSKATFQEIFSAYEGDDFAFDKTEILVHLADYKEETFISRSQAKRILVGLEKFSLITFDFKKIQLVGQGFVDEMFRVFVNNHPEIRILYINTIDSVKFMIERSTKVK